MAEMKLEAARQLINDAKHGKGSMVTALESIFDFDSGLPHPERKALASELGISFSFKVKPSELKDKMREALGVETESQRNERVAAEAAKRGLEPNKYAGRCSVSGEQVGKGEGFVGKGKDDKWILYSFATVETGKDVAAVNALAAFSDADLIAECRRRGLTL